MKFSAALKAVGDRGIPPISFLEELVEWGRIASEEIFAPNRVPVEAYTVIKSSLGMAMGNDASGTAIYKWESLLHRRAAMLELMRVHAGRESAWKWTEGVDRTNKTSMRNKTGEEAGIFQVSFDSTWLDSVEGKDVMGIFLRHYGEGIITPEKFITAMKTNHPLAMEYYARLVRVSIAWAGPLLRQGEDSVYPYLSRSAVLEFESLLS